MSRQSMRAMSPRLGQPKDHALSAEATLRSVRRGEKVPIDERIVMMAEAEYERQYSQPIWQVRERGGLGYGEMVTLLAEAVVRFAPDDAIVPRTLTRPAATPETER